MSGRVLMIALLAFTAVFAVGLWYAQFYAFYEEFEADSLTMGEARYAASDWQGIRGTSSPLKYRACFRLSAATAERLRAEQMLSDAGTPLVAPGWFDCFDAEQLTADLAAGRAEGFFIGPDAATGIDRHLALYPDGRAYAWAQLAPEFAESR